MMSSDHLRHVLYISGTRADYGLMKDTLRTISAHPRLRLSVLVTGMHLSEDFGNTVNEIERDGFEIVAKVGMLASDDTPAAMARSLGNGLADMATAFEQIRPDFVLLEGDRGESLAAAIAAAHMSVAVAHVSGGDVTGTTVDESIRHAITKFAHLHFPGTELSARRLVSMGEDPWRVHMVGTPGTNLAAEPRLSREELVRDLGLALDRPLLLALQHPVTTQVDEAPVQMRETMEAVTSFGYDTVVVYPNADAGGRAMIEVIEEYEHLPHVHTFKSLPREAFVALLSVTSVMVGNSSSALTEAPCFALPAVNVGSRQQGRERGGNLIDTGHNSDEISVAVQHGLDHLSDPAFRARCAESPYQDVDAAAQIADVLSMAELGIGLVQKRFYDGDR